MPILAITHVNNFFGRIMITHWGIEFINECNNIMMIFYRQCGSPIIPECAPYLPYSSTNISVELQNAVKQQYLHMAERLSGCYNASIYYMCSFIAPGCAVNVISEETLEVSFLVVEPCRQTCEGMLVGNYISWLTYWHLGLISIYNLNCLVVYMKLEAFDLWLRYTCTCWFCC